MEKKLRCNTQYIDFYLQKHKISKKEFCDRCGIKLSSLNGVYEQRNVTADKIFYICEVLNITIDTFLFLEKRNKQPEFVK